MRFNAQDLICSTIRGNINRGAAVLPGWRYDWSRDYRAVSSLLTLSWRHVARDNVTNV